MHIQHITKEMIVRALDRFEIPLGHQCRHLIPEGTTGIVVGIEAGKAKVQFEEQNAPGGMTEPIHCNPEYLGPVV